MAVKAERCANCGATIGRLETAYLWQDQVVCGRCIEVLRGQEGSKGLSKLNERQHKALMIGLIIFVIMGVFPPLERGGYAPVFYKPHSSYGIDVSRLVIQWLTVIAGASVAIILMADRKQKKKQKWPNWIFWIIFCLLVLLLLAFPWLAI